MPGSRGSGYLVRTRDAALVLDLGQGCLPSLAARHDPASLSGVFISHLHPDHLIDLIPLRHYLRRAGAEAPTRVPLHAPARLDARLDAVWGEEGFSAAAFEHHDLEPGRVESGPFDVEVASVRHAGRSFAFRVALTGGGAGIAYSGDIADADGLAPLLRPGDLLLSEATMGPGPVPEGTPHIDGSDVGRLAARGGAGQVVITHVRMGVDADATLAAARRHFAGPISWATLDARFLVPVA